MRYSVSGRAPSLITAALALLLALAVQLLNAANADASGAHAAQHVAASVQTSSRWSAEFRSGQAVSERADDADVTVA